MMNKQFLTTSIETLAAERFSTADRPQRDRLEWLKEVIAREYANVDITPPKKDELFNEMLIYPWQQLRLSTIRSHAISLERLPQEPSSDNQNCFFAVMLCSGNYKLEQGGREVFLQPGEMTIYDATRPHRITVPTPFNKILISIPRELLKPAIRNIDDLTATKLSATNGLAAITANLIQTTVQQLNVLKEPEFNALAEPLLELLTQTLTASQSIQNLPYTKHRRLLLSRAKQQIMVHLCDPDIDATSIASKVGLSKRYLNSLFSEEKTSLMHFVQEQRMTICRRQLLSSLQNEKP